MGKDIQKNLALTAAAGMVAGLVACGGAKKPAADPSEMTPDADVPEAGDMAEEAAGAEKDCCKGKNECKGKGNCKTDTNECKGQNECKEKGGCAPEGCH